MTSHFKHLFHPTTESPLFCTAAVNVLKQKTESMMGTSWHRMEIFDWQGRYSAFGFFYLLSMPLRLIEWLLSVCSLLSLFTLPFFFLQFLLVCFYFTASCSFGFVSSLFLHCSGSRSEFSLKMKTKNSY